MGPKKIIHVGLENQVETGWRTCGALGITLRFLRVQLNLAARLADTSHSVSPAVPGGLLGRRPVLLGAALWLAACSHEAGPIVIGVAGRSPSLEVWRCGKPPSWRQPESTP